MSSIPRMLIVIAVCAVALTACASEDPVADEPDADNGEVAAEDGDATEEPTEGGEDAEDDTDDDAMGGDGAMVAVGATDLGEVLTDGEGMTLYLFESDEQGESTCYDDCAGNWPPLTTDGEPTAGDGADGSLLGTTERDDGSMQVTYNDWPLYYWAADAEAGDVQGQGVGDVWWVVDADGEAVRDTGDEADAGGNDSAEEREGGAGY